MNLFNYERPTRRLEAGGAEQFGIRSLRQLMGDYKTLAHDSLTNQRFQFSISSLGHLRPTLSIPAYLGYMRKDGLSPIINLFDRTGGGKDYGQRVSRNSIKDFRGGRLGYDEHDGVDFVCPPGTPLCAAAPGTVIYQRDCWLRGGLTIMVDHGCGLVTHYTHCTRPLKPIGAQVQRGEPVAVSGTSGVDMTTFFPLVPPHIHFMVWDCGQPVDPFLSMHEKRTHGVWENRNQPLPHRVNSNHTEPQPEPSAVDSDKLTKVIERCTSEELRTELLSTRDQFGLPSAAALAEDMLHHDRYAWEAPDMLTVRPDIRTGFSDIQLTLPLPKEDYRGSFFCDNAWTRPS